MLVLRLPLEQVHYVPHRPGPLPLHQSGEVPVDQVVGDGVKAHQRQAQETGGIHGLVVVGRGAHVMHLADAGGHDVLGDVDRDPQPLIDVLMEVEGVPEGWPRPAEGVVADDRVDRYPPLPQPVGQDHLPGGDVYSPEHPSDLRRRIAVHQPGVGIGVPQRIQVEARPLLPLHLPIALLRPPEVVLQLIRGPWVAALRHLNCEPVDLS